MVERLLLGQLLVRGESGSLKNIFVASKTCEPVRDKKRPLLCPVYFRQNHGPSHKSFLRNDPRPG